MGKQGKPKNVITGRPLRPGPYSNKPRVDVVFEGAPPPQSFSKPKTTALPSAPSTSSTSSAKPQVKPKNKGKEKAIESPAVIPQESSTPLPTFKIIAGTYEKLLYGLEGSYTLAKSTSDEKNPTLSLTPIFIFPAHLACVKAVAASPGGKWLATGSEDEFIKVWDLRRRKEVGSLSEHTGSITSVTFPTSSHLLAASVDSTISLFRTSDWSLLKSLKGHSGRVNHIDVHPTGRVALSVGKDLTLKMWDLMRGRGAASLGLGTEAELVKFSPLGTHFAVLFPKVIQIYSLTLKLLHTLTTKSRFNTLLFATLPKPDTEKETEVLCVGTEKGEIEVYGITIGSEEGMENEAEGEEEDEKGSGAEVFRIGTLVGHLNRVKSISSLPFFVPPSPSSSEQPKKTVLLTSASSDGFINLYDLSQVFASSSTENREESEHGVLVEPSTKYDTKGSRLTCVFLADGGIAKSKTAVNTEVMVNGKTDGKDGKKVVVAEVESDQDEEDEGGEQEGDIYADGDVEDSEEDDDGLGGMEVEFEDEEEEGEEDEQEYED